MANYTLKYSGAEVDQLLDKIDTAFGEETIYSDTITWDGDMTGKPVVSLDMGEDGVMNFCKVSDAIPTIDDFNNGLSVTLVGMGTIEYPTEALLTGEGFIMEGDCAFIVISEPNTTIDDLGLTFSESGVWFVSIESMGLCVSALTINNYTGFEGVKTIKIPAKYIPTEGEVVFTIDGSMPSAIGTYGTATCNKSVGELFGIYRKDLINCSINHNHELLNDDDEVTKIFTSEFKPYCVRATNDIENGYESIGIGFAENTGTAILHYVIAINTNSSEMIVMRSV